MRDDGRPPLPPGAAAAAAAVAVTMPDSGGALGQQQQQQPATQPAAATTTAASSAGGDKDAADVDVAIADASAAAARDDDDAAMTDDEEAALHQPGWRSAPYARSLPESHSTVKVPGPLPPLLLGGGGDSSSGGGGSMFFGGGGFAGSHGGQHGGAGGLAAALGRRLLNSLRTIAAFAGVGGIISVGYMDPGNWATGLAGGARFGYALLFVILLSNVAAMFLQHLSLKLGVATGRDLAQACRDAYPRWACYLLWVAAEVAIAACDLAEVIGAAVAMKLLFGLPLWAGVLITAADVALVALLENRSFRWLELFIALLILLIFGCFMYELAVAQPVWSDVARGLAPSKQLFTDPGMLYIAIGILGATVMPHNLYLHSAVIQTRAYDRAPAGRARAIRYGTLDSSVSLLFAFVINASILILAGAAFHYGPSAKREAVDITDAYELLSPSLGAKAASVVFALALLASGQNSTITGTLAGQVVMEGFLRLRMRPVLRRVLTRSVALVPAIVVAAVGGDAAVGKLLVISQVVLSMQLPFAVFPLVHFTSLRKFTGRFANSVPVSILALLLAVVIALLNGYLLVSAARNPAGLDARRR